MAITLVSGQTVGVASTSSGAVTLNLPANAAPGNLVAVQVAGYTGAAATFTVTDATGTVSFTRASPGTPWSASWGIQTEIWYLANAPAGISGAKITSSGSTLFSAAVSEWSGCDPAAPLSGSPSNNAAVTAGGTTAASSGNVVPLYNGCLIFAGGTNGGQVVGSACSNTPGTGFTSLYNPAASSSYLNVISEYQIQTTAGAVSGTFTLSTSTAGWWADAVVFAPTLTTYEQVHYRWRNDDGSENTATWQAAQDAATTQPISSNIRLRVLVDSAVANPPPNPFQLEFKKSTDSSYATVLATQPTLQLPAFVAKGTFTSGAAALTVAVPAGYQANDLLVLFVETANQAMTTPAGWTQVTNSPQSTGTAAAAGGVRLTVFYKVATSSEASVSLADSGDHQTAIMMAFRGVDNTTPFNITAGSVDATAGTAISCPAVTTTVANCLIVNAIALDRDLASTTNVSGWANANLIGITEQHDQTVATGAGGGLAVATGGLTTAGSTGSTTATDATSEVRCYLTMALAPTPVTQQAVLLSASANIAAGGTTATTAQLSPPASGAFRAGAISDDTNPLPAIDLATDEYTELEWCLQATGQAANGDVYQFRVTVAGTALDTYTVTPQWTIGSAVSTTPVGTQAQTLWNLRAPIGVNRQGLWQTRTTLAKTRQTLWNSRVTTSSSRQYLWQVRTAQGGSRQALWNLRVPVGANRQELWQTRTTLARTRQTLWNIRTSATTSRQQLWNLRATTAVNRQEWWNLRATTTVSRQELWQTRTTLARTHQALWNSRVTTSKSRQHLWQVRTAQGGGRQLAWYVRANVGAMDTTRWTVRGSIGASQEDVWLVRSLLRVSTQYTWNVSELAPPTAVGNQIQTIWNLHATAAIDRQGRWQVRNTLTMPLLALWNNLTKSARTLTATWALHGLAKSPISTLWEVRTLVDQDRQTRWNSRATLSPNTTQRWQTRTNLSRTNTFAWPIRQILPREVSASWQVFSVVPTTLVTTSQSFLWTTLGKTAATALASWNTRTLSGPELLTRWQDRTSSLRDLTFVWKIRLTTAQARTLSWHTRATTAHDRAFLWEVRQGLSLQVSHIWPVRLGVNRTVQSQWRQRSLSQTTLQLLWNALALQVPVATQSVLTWNLQTNTTRDAWTHWQVKSLTACQRLMRWVLHDRRAWKAATLQEDARSTRLESQSGTQLDPAPYGGGGLQETS